MDRRWEAAFGLASLWVALAVLATAPVLQLISFGYLLEASGRVARTGRLRDAAVGAHIAARWGSVALGGWLLLLAPRLIASLAGDARLVSPAGAGLPENPAARRLDTLLVVACVWVVLHTTAAVWRGGRLRHFLWPRPVRLLRELIADGGFARAAHMLRRRLAELRLGRLFWLGLQGLACGLAWLALPTTLLAAGAWAPAVGLVGGVMLAAVALHLPLLQARLAMTGRFGQGFHLRGVWSGYARAPLLHTAAVAATLLLAAPLYLLKVELVPREAAWLPGLLFVASAWPTRVLAGLAVAHARRAPRRWWRASLGVASVVGLLGPIACVYALVVFASRYTSWHGVASLYEQHAFLLPAPLLGL
ncbi:MAG: hypothetical protein AAF790_08470 [Planctomycetota bacterium]